MATTTDVQITKPGAEGDLYYRQSDGVLIPLPIPSDADTVSYVLGISAGVPAWRTASENAFAGLFPALDLFPDTTLFPEAP